jgi:hypothetical protein
LVAPELLLCVSDLWWHCQTGGAYSSAGRCRRCARLGTEEEAVEDLVILEQVDKGTRESQDGVECKKAKQNDIDMKYEDGGIDGLRRVGQNGCTTPSAFPQISWGPFFLSFLSTLFSDEVLRRNEPPNRLCVFPRRPYADRLCRFSSPSARTYCAFNVQPALHLA